MNFVAWQKPKAAENQFIYTMLGASCHLIVCLRAKEKIKIVKGADPIPLGWQPIVGERVAFETIFTLMLPPHSKGVPDLTISEMREPFDAMVPAGQPLNEETGKQLAAWAAGAAPETAWATEDDVTAVLEIAAGVGDDAHDKIVAGIAAHRDSHGGNVDAAWLKRQSAALLKKAAVTA
jgi:hypothetical protein